MNVLFRDELPKGMHGLRVLTCHAQVRDSAGTLLNLHLAENIPIVRPRLTTGEKMEPVSAVFDFETNVDPRDPAISPLI